MKKVSVFIFTLIILSGFYCVKSQLYTEFDFDSGIWMCEFMGCPGDICDNKTIQYYCKGETIINDTNYYKLFYYQYHLYSFEHPDSGRYSNGYYGAINNFPDKTVRLVKAGETKSKIIYDFNLEVGDTIKRGYGSEWEMYYDTLTIKSIDSIEICGKYHKRYYYFDDSYSAIIEGIGSVYGLIDPIMTTMLNVGSHLKCYTELDNNNCDKCNLLLSTSNFYNKIKSLNVYQYLDQLYINSEHEIKGIYIFDLLGNAIFKKNDICDFKFIIPVSEIQHRKGLILVKVLFNKNQVIRKIYIR